MITAPEARKAAQDYLDTKGYRAHNQDDARVIDDEATLERDYGWLFIYNTANFVRTRDRRHGLVGNGPLLVLREDGSLIQFSSGYDREEALAVYEADPDKFMAEAIRPA